MRRYYIFGVLMAATSSVIFMNCKARQEDSGEFKGGAKAPRDDRSYTAFGVQPDCSETSVSYDDLLAIINKLPNDPKIDSVVAPF